MLYAWEGQYATSPFDELTIKVERDPGMRGIFGRVVVWLVGLGACTGDMQFPMEVTDASGGSTTNMSSTGDASSSTSTAGPEEEPEDGSSSENEGGRPEDIAEELCIVWPGDSIQAWNKCDQCLNQTRACCGWYTACAEQQLDETFGLWDTCIYQMQCPNLVFDCTINSPGYQLSLRVKECLEKEASGACAEECRSTY